MLINPPLWMNDNNSAKMSGPKTLHCAVKDSLSVITKAAVVAAVSAVSAVAQHVIRMRSNHFLHTGPWRIRFFPLIINIFI